MASFEAHRNLATALGEERAEAVAGYVEESTRERATRADLAELRADFAELRADFAELRADFSESRGAMYRALWIQGVAIVMINSAVVGSAAALASIFA